MWSTARLRRARANLLLVALLLSSALLAVPPQAALPSVVAAQASCSPRPSFTPQTALAGEGRLRVTVTGGAPALQSVTIRSATNARILLDGQTGPATLPVTLPSASGAPIAFTVEQVAAGQAMTVPLLVVDGCGAGETLVGSGVAGLFTPTPTPMTSCTPRPSATPAVANVGGGRLQVTITGGAPPLRSVTVKGLTNARLFMGNQQFVGTPPTTIP
jgi:hypothetical protein